MLQILSLLCLLAVYLLVPALTGYLVGGNETTAWATSVSALAVYMFTRPPK